MTEEPRCAQCGATGRAGGAGGRGAGRMRLPNFRVIASTWPLSSGFC